MKNLLIVLALGIGVLLLILLTAFVTLNITSIAVISLVVNFVPLIYVYIAYLLYRKITK